MDDRRYDYVRGQIEPVFKAVQTCTIEVGDMLVVWFKGQKSATLTVNHRSKVDREAKVEMPLTQGYRVDDTVINHAARLLVTLEGIW